MKLILVITFIIIFFIEIYSLLSKITPECKTLIKDDSIDISDLKFESIELFENSMIPLNNCYIYITETENIFIINDQEFILLIPGKVYDINKESTLEFVFIKNPLVYYLCKKNVPL